jgi:hypothetical protein
MRSFVPNSVDARPWIAVMCLTVFIRIGSYELERDALGGRVHVRPMEVDMLSIGLRSGVLGAILGATCAMHPAMAQANEASVSSWSSYFDCAEKEKTIAIAGISGSTFSTSNLLTDKGARNFVQALGGSAGVARQAGPIVLSVAKSPLWKTAWGVVAYSSGAFALYQQFRCPPR